MNSLGNFFITLQDSMDFAFASGDFNPLHLDPVAARRTRFGQTLIHGVCGTVKALDLLLQQRGTNAQLLSIKVKYNKPATQGRELAVFAQTANGATRLELFADGVRCQIIDLVLEDLTRRQQAPGASFKTCDSAYAAVDLSIEACNDLADAVELYWDEARMARLFPSATRYLPPQQLATLLGSTRIVGMRCPGLHSVFAQLDLQFSAVDPDATTMSDTQLTYQVLRTDPRIDRVELGLGNAYAQGTVEAFFRPPPVQQASIEQIARLVAADEFSAQRALVIGASRGLGEVITKVLAAGGAKIMMTYAAGKADAENVCAEIGQHLDTPQMSLYNVLEGSADTNLANFCASVTHIYYLASPTIAKSDSGKWDRQLFARYCNFYIDGLATLLQLVAQHRDGNAPLQVFIPSSIFVEQSTKGFDEYIAAKSAAEAFGRCYAKSHGHCSVLAPRLPRLYTDQTSSIKNTDEQQTLKVIIEQLRLASYPLN